MHMHEHLHLFEDGLRRLVHAHRYPEDANDPLATRAHSHTNGQHSHPHVYELHDLYEPLPEGVERRPIVPVGAV